MKLLLIATSWTVRNHIHVDHQRLGSTFKKKGNVTHDGCHVFMNIRSFREQKFRIHVGLKDFYLTAVISESLSRVVSLLQVPLVTKLCVSVGNKKF